MEVINNINIYIIDTCIRKRAKANVIAIINVQHINIITSFSWFIQLISRARSSRFQPFINATVQGLSVIIHEILGGLSELRNQRFRPTSIKAQSIIRQSVCPAA